MLSAVVSLLAPVPCLGCGARARNGLCRRCAESLPPPTDTPPPRGVDAWGAAHPYAGAWRSAVVAAKSRHARSVLAFLADHVAAALPPGDPPDVVTWPPTTRARRRRRGFDQAEVLARAVARAVSRPAARLLIRDPRAPAQQGRGRADRTVGPHFRATRRVDGLSVLVVDDVATTGATLSAAAGALRAAGAHRVVAATAARTAAPPAREIPTGSGPANATESEKELQIDHATSDSGG